MNRVDELLADDHSPEAVLGGNGLLKQLSQRLVERALAGELSHHQSASAPDYLHCRVISAYTKIQKLSLIGNSKVVLLVDRQRCQTKIQIVPG